MKKAYVFPGQGSQFPGMAKELYDTNATAKEMLDKANDILGFRITDIMFSGTPEDLKQTKVTQPAIFLHSVVLAKCYEGFNPDMVAGHSLGEFSALAAAGAMEFEEALKLVSIRARAMQKACEIKPSTMAAIIALPTEKVEEICASCNGIVVPANYNCDGQIVISGEIEAVNEACEKMKAAGAKRALVLPVGGAFHSPLMEPARMELAEGIEKAVFNTPVCPVYQNVTALPSTDPATIKQNLLTQLTSPVRWTQSVKNMVADGAGYFMEIGPGTVLQGLVKKIAGNEVEVTCSVSGSLFPGERLVICSQETFERLTGADGLTMIGIQLDEDADEGTLQQINKLTGSDVIFTDTRVQNRESNTTYMALRLGVYGFLSIIGMVTMFYIMNSISISVAARTKQYGAMRAVGMDGTQLILMIVAEAFTYAVSGLICGFGIGLPLSYLLYDQLVTRHMGMVWHPPVALLCLIVLFVAVCAAAAVYAPAKRIRNMAITETINEL